jgi:hypothetical protein
MEAETGALRQIKFSAGMVAVNRSNKGAPGVDGQDFADIEAYGVQRWLAKLVARPPPIASIAVPRELRREV